MLTRLLANLQQLGRALMLPIAVLPVAGLLLRLGQPDLLNFAPMAAAGNAIFSNLGLIFSIGVAVGLARENHGAAGLAAVVGFLVATNGTEALIQVPAAALQGLPESAQHLGIDDFRAQVVAKLSVPLGIISGLIAGATYNRWSNIQLPSYLAFFAGRRFVPIATGAFGLIVASVFGLLWPSIEHGMDALSRAVLGSGYWGLFGYGVLNRLLLVTGLHHILNNLAWFILGDFHGVTGDLKRFFAGDPSAGQFMSGFFPVMMFGLPGACLAMYYAVLPVRRRAVAGLLLSIALTSFLTGVTEPIEFSFMFLAPALFALHAVLTGVAMMLMQALGVHLGFGFSAGLFDFVLNFSRSTRPWLLLPIGALYFVAYFGLFRFCIWRFDLRTPGREPAAAADRAVAGAASPVAGNRPEDFIAALGGADNLLQIDACTTRLRIQVVDTGRVSSTRLRELGAAGTVQLSAQAMQVVLGPIADQIAAEIRTRLQRSPATPATPAPIPPPATEAAGSGPLPATDALLSALGGQSNIRALEAHGGRVLVNVHRGDSVDQSALGRLIERGVAHPNESSFHLLIGASAHHLAAALEAAS